MWFKRLVDAIDEHPDSHRAISLRAGFSDTYLHQMITYEKHPSVSRFIAICAAIGKDPVEILKGAKSDADTGALSGAASSAKTAGPSPFGLSADSEYQFDGWHIRLKERIQKELDGGETAIGIARRASLNRTQVDDMLRKDTRPRVDTFIKLCGALRVDPTEILTGITLNSDTAQALRLFAGLSTQQQKAVVALMDTMQPPPNPPT